MARCRGTQGPAGFPLARTQRGASGRRDPSCPRLERRRLCGNVGDPEGACRDTRLVWALRDHDRTCERSVWSDLHLCKRRKRAQGRPRKALGRLEPTPRVGRLPLCSIRCQRVWRKPCPGCQHRPSGVLGVPYRRRGRRGAGRCHPRTSRMRCSSDCAPAGITSWRLQ